jgi:hypothetical protein
MSALRAECPVSYLSILALRAITCKKNWALRAITCKKKGALRANFVQPVL